MSIYIYMMETAIKKDNFIYVKLTHITISQKLIYNFQFNKVC